MSGCFFYVLTIIILIKCTQSMFYKSNFSDLSQCNVSYSRSSSTYKDFYPLRINDNQSLIVDFHFAVLATSDAHILLAESENVSKTDPAYEIVIGAGGNTFCDIRRMQKSDVRHSVRIRGLLSALDPHFFWLHIIKDGNSGIIEVGREGDNASFIDWLDPELLPVKVVSFSTWSGIEAKWYFNCDRSDTEEEIEKRLTTLEKLRRHLLKVYDPVVGPGNQQSPVTEIVMTLNLEHIELDAYRSIIEIRGITTLQWRDSKLMWNSESYDNLTSIKMMKTEIWHPSLKCLNAVSDTTEVLLAEVIGVTNEGQVSWESMIHVKTKCDEVEWHYWPKDIYECKIMLSFSGDNANMLLNFNDTASSLLQHEKSQWQVMEASVFDVETNNMTADTTPFGLYFKVRRYSELYAVVFFMPFFAIASCLLLSFWIPPHGHLKICMGCTQLILEVIMLVTLKHCIPEHSGQVTFITLLYTWCLIGSLVSLTLATIIINVCTKQHSKPLHHVVCRILRNKVVKTVLFLPNLVVPEEYGDLDISLSSTTLSRNEEKVHFWALLGIAIDRLSFLIYTPIIATLVVKCILMISS